MDRGSNVRVDDVAIQVTADGQNATANGATAQGSVTADSTLELTDVSIEVAASGIGSESVGVRATGYSAVRIESSEIDAQGGSSGGAVDASGPGNVIRIDASDVSGGNAALSINGDNVDDNEYIAVTGGSVVGSESDGINAELRCNGVFDENFRERASDCRLAIM